MIGLLDYLFFRDHDVASHKDNPTSELPAPRDDENRSLFVMYHSVPPADFLPHAIVQEHPGKPPVLTGKHVRNAQFERGEAHAVANALKKK